MEQNQLENNQVVPVAVDPLDHLESLLLRLSVDNWNVIWSYHNFGMLSLDEVDIIQLCKTFRDSIPAFQGFFSIGAGPWARPSLGAMMTVRVHRGPLAVLHREIRLPKGIFAKDDGENEQGFDFSGTKPFLRDLSAWKTLVFYSSTVD